MLMELKMLNSYLSIQVKGYGDQVDEKELL